ncbi:LytTR family transcriptional regulator DNA-binding domain-containing protein [Paenibacillus sp. Leaf72]
MMNTGLNGERNIYEDFEIESDVLFFKVGMPELVSFHGRNYNIKKRMTGDQIRKLIDDSHFYQVSSNCYINIRKVKAITDGIAYFGTDASDSKNVPIPRRKQTVIKQLLGQAQ